tara:strand:- start:688 stop:1548 length:861 start_codon:yes stop_codon:yes gene_type:complete
MIKVLVTGSDGQLGQSLKFVSKNYSKIEWNFMSKNQLDIQKFDQIISVVLNKKIQIIINCAAYTNVENSEIEFTKAFGVNSNGVKNLVNVCEKLKLKLIHISTDYVFDGNKNGEYQENNITNPISIYAKSKFEGENNVIRSNSETLVLRTSWLFSPYGKNFVKTIIKRSKHNGEIKVVNDQFGKPTYAMDLAQVIIALIFNKNSFKNKVYHFANSGKTSWYNFAKKIISYKKIECKLIPVSSSFFNYKAIRPRNSSLSTKFIENNLNLEIRSWNLSLKDCLKLINE